ncbi:hypothetical protein [Mycobacterium sp.]|uniref:hypothetical protein n=1 Tax=Mycobacterium sp. TaxID=1785 RepID=UPI003BAF2DBA
MSSRTALAAQEDDSAMSDDTDPVADEADLLDPEEVEGEDDSAEAPVQRSRRFSWTRLLVAGLPVLALILALGVGYLKWLDGTARESHAAAEASVRAASESTVAILSYKPETVDRDLKAAADRLSEPFRRQYTQLVNDVVAPGAKQQHITAVATVPAAASVLATGKHAVVLVFVDQTTTIGTDAPTQSTSSVRVSLEKIDGRWLISQFDPV